MFKALTTETGMPFEADCLRIFDGLVEVKAVESHDEDHMAELIVDCDAFLSIYVFAKVTRKMIDAAPRLKVIGRYGMGTDNIDMDAANERGIVVTNCPVYHVPTVPELVISFIFALSRRIPAYSQSVKSGQWNHELFLGNEVEGKTLGILGLGRIGSTTAGKAIGLGMRVIGHDPLLGADQLDVEGLEFADPDTVIREADFLSLNMPLTHQTRGTIGADVFRRMKDSAYLINTARGAIVDEDALCDALTGGQIAGAALDVMAVEPPQPGHRLYDMDNVIITPHVGGSTVESFARLGRIVSQGVMEVLQNRKPQFIRNPEVLDKLNLE